MNHHRNGFATVLAIFLLALLSAMLVGLVAVSQNQFHRTLEAEQQAKLRQVLLAGTIDAVGRMKNWNPASAHSWEFESPDEQGTVQIVVQNAAANQIEIEMVGHFASHQMRQVLVFNPNGTGWQLVEANLQ